MSFTRKQAREAAASLNAHVFKQVKRSIKLALISCPEVNVKRIFTNCNKIQLAQKVSPSEKLKLLVIL